MAPVVDPERVRRGAQTHPDVEVMGQVNEEIVGILGRPGRGWWALFLFAAAGVVLLLASWAHQLIVGLGASGLSVPVAWGVYVTSFVFWVGIAISGTLISAVLLLVRAPWRQAVYRVAEAMTVLALMTAGLFPLIQLGRAWHFYWLLPYPNSGLLRPNFASPLVWDLFAVATFFTVAAVLFFLGAIPDLAAARDGTTGLRKKFYNIVSLGWRGTDRQWHHFGKAYLFLAALAVPLALSVQSAVSWNFAMAIVPGWHSTIFAPYFVAGAVYSGVAMVLTLIIPMRKALGLEKYVTTKHLDALAKLCLLAALVVTYSYAVEFFMAWYGAAVVERATIWNRMFGPYWWASWTMITCTAIVPQLLWFKRVRYSIPALWVISIFVNIGMWLEGYAIIVTSLYHGYEPFVWHLYRPSFTEMGILIGSFCWFLFWFMIFTRVVPPVAISELKEILPPRLRHPSGEAPS